VTITESGNNGDGNAQSYLKAHLVVNESYTISNFAGSGEALTITAVAIDISSEPGIATICVTYGNDPSCGASPTPNPTPPVSCDFFIFSLDFCWAARDVSVMISCSPLSLHK
jgi:hypothetical protein